jgi:PAS domain S-box-containing protein
MAKSELEKYKETVSARLSQLSPLLQNYALGDFSESIEIPEKDEFTELLVGLSLMVDDIRELVQGKESTITELKQAEEALRESEVHYRSLFANMAEGVCLHEVIYDDAGEAVDYRITDVNPKYETTLGITRKQAVGSLGSKLYGADEPPYLDIYTKVAETGVPTYFETYFPPMDRHFAISVFSPDKGRFATVFSDITERKRAEEELARHVAELERFNCLAVGREQRMIELKRQVNELSEELGREPPYDVSFADDIRDEYLTRR